MTALLLCLVTLGDLERFPPREVIDAQLELSRSWMGHLERRAEVDRANDLTAALDYARHCYRAWQALASARNEDWLEYDRVLWLENPCDEIGPADYACGTMPWPVCGFSEVR